MTTETVPVKEPRRLARPLSARQLAVLRAIAGRISERGSAPTFREIGAAPGVGTASNSVISYHLARLAERGLIVMGEGEWRGITITDATRRMLPELFPPTPAEAIVEAVRGAHAAGEPLPARVVAALEAVA